MPGLTFVWQSGLAAKTEQALVFKTSDDDLAEWPSGFEIDGVHEATSYPELILTQPGRIKHCEHDPAEHE